LAANLAVLLTLIVALQVPSFAFLQSAADPSDPNNLYGQAMTAYNQNRFTDAKTLFESVRGAHAEDAPRARAPEEHLEHQDVHVQECNEEDEEFRGNDHRVTVYQERLVGHRWQR